MRLLKQFICLLLVFLPLIGTRSYAAPPARHMLDSDWEFRQVAPANAHAESMTGEWHPAVVPGDVHLDLLRDKLIPEPFYRDNETKLQWIEAASWEYRTTVVASTDILHHEHVDLVFEGLDAACTVFVNGLQIATPDNMFRVWRFDVRSQLKPGKNEIRIIFPPPVKAAAAVAAQDPWHDRTHTDPKAYIRKAVYEFGWDWGPRFVTSGIFRPAYLETWDEARISDIFTEQEDVSAAVAHLDVHTTVLASHSENATVDMTYGTGDKTLHTSRSITLGEGSNRISVPIDIARPELWFPAGYGAQPIYHFHVSVKTNGRELDAKDVKTGLRSVVLRRDLDQWGRSFEFVVNGIPIFAKGADVIPFDSFPSRVTDQQYEHILRSAKDANMNMVRLWGGGYYEKQEFYDLCDQLGLMVWHDMMFGNNWQPGTYQFKQEIQREAEYQMTRLRNHPSIVLWSGNNETELLRDWNGNGQLPAAVHERIWQDYLTEFSGILASTAARVDPQTPYWPSSPSADYEDLSDAYQSGDNHDWTVWHGGADFSAYEQHHWRFVSEYGFQSFPEMKTVESFTTPEDRANIFTPVMLAHQKNDSGNSLIHDYMLRYYGEPKDFASFLYASQVLQAEAVKVGAEGWRRDRPRTMGSIFWQLNDCWPVASWSSIDYYGRWKALQYYAQRFYAPVLVSPHVEDGVIAVYIVSDHSAPEQAQLRLRIMHFDGSMIREVQQSVTVKPFSSQRALAVPLSELQEAGKPSLDPSQIFVAAELSIAGHIVSSNVLYLAPSKQVHLPEASITTNLTKLNDGFDLTLHSPVLARDVYVSFTDADATFSDNYVDLLPGETKSIHVSSSAGLNVLQAQLSVRSLAGTFIKEPAK
jgi:beta-mannosidase